MNYQEIFYILTITVIPLGAALVLWLLFWRFYKTKKNCLAKSKVKGILRSYCSIRKYRVLRNVTIKIEGKEITLPFVVVGIFGILIITTMESYGNIYGNLDDPKWVCDDEKKVKKWYIPNYVKQNEAVIEQLRKGLSARGIYKTQIDHITVFPHRGKELGVAHTLPVIRLEKLKKYLLKDRFNKENKVDIGKLSSAVLDICADTRKA